MQKSSINYSKMMRISEEKTKMLNEQESDFVFNISMHGTDILLGTMCDKETWAKFPIQQMQTTFGALVKECEQSLLSKQSMETILLRADTCSHMMINFITQLQNAHHDDLVLKIGKVFYKFVIEFKELTKQGVDANLVISKNVKAAACAVLADISTQLVFTCITLKQTHRALAYVDEALSALDGTLNDDQTLGVTRASLHKIAFTQLLEIKEFDKAVRFLEKTLAIWHKWHEDETFVKQCSGVVRELMKQKTLGSYQKAERLCVIMQKSKKPHIVKFAKDCIDFIEKKQDELSETSHNKSSTTNKKTSKQHTTTATINNQLVDVKAIKNTNTTAAPTATTTISTTVTSDQKANTNKVETENANEVKQKIKTRKPANPGKEEVEEKSVISDAEKYGFSEEFKNETIYPLQSDLIPSGIYYAMYPKANIEKYQLAPGVHQKNIQILQDGIIGAGGNRVRYNKKQKDSFKIGRKRSDSRFFSRIKQVTDDDKILLSFEVLHNHKSQPAEYEKKPGIEKKS